MTSLSFPLYSEDLAAAATTTTTSQKEDRMDNDDNIGGYAVPVDPMDLLQCDSCQ
jgi:hypothetical protein